MRDSKVSEAVIRRLPRYYRQLELLAARNVDRISSSELAQQMDLNASQVRQDLNCFGGFGQQGYGYHVETLLTEISNILGLNRRYKLVIVGAGNMGTALSNYEAFHKKGFDITALFDIKDDLIGTTIAGCPVLPVEQLGSYIRDNNVDIGVICARRSAAQGIADTMVDAGIKAIWNYVPTDIHATVPIENIHVSDSMLVLAYRMNESRRS